MNSPVSSPEPKVTIVVVPRERFSYARQSLESIYEQTKVPFKLIYIDGNSPRSLRKYLKQQSQEKGFKIISTDHYLFPNRSRNMGLAEVDTPYVVFADNDIVVSPSWLEALLNCAEETDAAVVGPLMCQYEPIHEEIHFAGGESRVIVDARGRRLLREKMYKQGQKVSAALPKLHRMETELCEFHCMLARTQLFDKVGPLDEGMLNTKEHLDFCMTLGQAGETVYFEPKSIVTYVPTSPLNRSDLHFYMLRWSDAWEAASLGRMQQKWNLNEDGYYFQRRHKLRGWRRHNTVLKPIVRRVTFDSQNAFLQKLVMYGLLVPVERILNRFLTDQYAHRHLQPSASQSATPTVPVSQQEPVGAGKSS
ncbi:MAG: glycosyltransferase family 2 protein [Microcoleaceae cyanobacterium]